MKRLALLLTFTFLFNGVFSLPLMAQDRFPAKKIMFGVMPYQDEGVNVTLMSFLSFCDSIFKKSQVAKTALVLEDDFFEEENCIPEKYGTPITQFKTDAFILFFPSDFTSFMKRKTVKFEAYLLDVSEFYHADCRCTYPIFSISTKDKPFKVKRLYLGTFKLSAYASDTDSKKNGIKIGHKFIDELKKYMSNLE